MPIEKAGLPLVAATTADERDQEAVQAASFIQPPEVPSRNLTESAVAAGGAAEEVAPPEISSAKPAVAMRVGEEGLLRQASALKPERVSPPVPEEAARLQALPAAGASRLSVDVTDTLRLMYALQSDDTSDCEAAAVELAARGFNEMHLDLARQLTSRKADVRAAVAGKLPGTPGIDARLWLTWLMRDESTDVRLAALSVLATTGQSDALRRAIEIARQDRDPRVRRVLKQLDQQRRAAR